MSASASNSPSEVKVADAAADSMAAAEAVKLAAWGGSGLRADASTADDTWSEAPPGRPGSRQLFLRARASIFPTSSILQKLEHDEMKQIS